MGRLEGVEEELQNLADADMDDVGPRRRAHEAFKDIQLSLDHILFKMPCDHLKIKESYEKNSKGVEIFTKSWVEEKRAPKALVCFCHGYGDTSTFFFEGVGRKLACSGYGVFTMDYPGFGLSEGLHGYVNSFDGLVDDVIEQFSKVKGYPEFSSVPSFLFGESMGGAVALKVHLKQPDSWNGAILSAPMCKIADNMAPPWILTQILIGMSKLLPKSKLVPQDDLADLAFREERKRKLAAYNVLAYKHKPRLKTALELVNASKQIEHQLEKVSLPLLILHGTADKMTDPSVSKALYEAASSTDKKYNLYQDSYHALFAGEPDDIILKVLSDIVSWLDAHTHNP